MAHYPRTDEELEKWLNSWTQTPRMRQSLVRTSPGAWSLGTFMLCEEYTSKDFPYDSLAHWEDSGKKYCLRRRKTPITTKTPPDGDSDTGSFKNLEETTCHWELSPNVFVKARAWAPGLALEWDTITWARHTFPEIPVVKAIYGWADPAWERSFLITYRAKGEVLETAWPRLSNPEKISIVTDITNAIKKMATVTSETFRGIGGGLNYVIFLAAPKREPFQRPRAPRPHPQYTAEELDKKLDEYWDMIKVNPRCKKFIFFHGDLSPGNVFVEAKGNGSKACLTQIIDFEVSGFYPSWYPLINFRDRDYLLDTEEDWDSDYADGLVRYIRQFPNDFPDESEWKKARAATDNGFAKIRARQEIDDKEYEDEQLQKGKNKVKEAGIDEVASKLNALKPWWEWE